MFTFQYIFAAVLTLGLDGIMVFFKSRFRTAIFKSVPGGSTRIEVNGIAGGWRAGRPRSVPILTQSQKN